MLLLLLLQTLEKQQKSGNLDLLSDALEGPPMAATQGSQPASATTSVASGNAPDTPKVSLEQGLELNKARSAEAGPSNCKGNMEHMMSLLKATEQRSFPKWLREVPEDEFYPTLKSRKRKKG